MEHEVIRVFDRVAGQYDDILPFFGAFARELAAVLPLGPGVRVLDLGAGRGAVTGEALARGCQVTAIDAAPHMLDRLKNEHAGHPGLTAAHVMDAHQLDFSDASFDVVVSSFVIHVLDDPAAAVREAARVLVPGGLFAFTEPGLPPGYELPEQPGPPDPLIALFGEFSQYLTSDRGGMGRSLEERVLLGGAGFVDVRAAVISVDIPLPDGETYWQWGLTHGSLAYFDSLPPDRREEFHQRLVSAVDAVGLARLRRTAAVWSGRTPPA